MGRWAQRSRGGGGISTPIEMIDVSIQGSGQDAIFVDYSGGVNANVFDPADFSSSPSGAVGVAVSQNSIRQLRVDLDMTALGDTDFTYSGTLPSIVHPQTIAY